MKILLPILLGAMLAVLSLSPANAQVLLTINDSNPSAVTITATGTAPSTSVGSYPLPYGVDLLNFFTSDVAPSNPFADATSYSLTTGDRSSGPLFNQFSSDNLSTAGGNFTDLSLLNNDVDLSVLISFTTGDAAFSGTLTLNLNGAPLLAPGSTGNIVTGFYGSSGATPAVPNTIIGEYEVIPEPTTWALSLGGFGVLAFLRRRSLRA